MVIVRWLESWILIDAPRVAWAHHPLAVMNSRRVVGRDQSQNPWLGTHLTAVVGYSY
jgi:hypothetical protein